jgi:ABC-2 type transport system permease protein
VTATVARAYAGAAWAIVRRDTFIMLSYRLRLPMQAVTAAFSLALFYYVSRLVTVGKFASPDQYFAFVVIGMVILTVLTSTMSAAPQSLLGEMMSGTFQRTVVSPFGPVAGIAAMMLFPLLFSMVFGFVIVLEAHLVFGMAVQWATLPLVIPVCLLSALSFMPFGIAICSAVLVFKQAGSAAHVVVAILSLVAGLYFPIALLPGWIRWASEVQPFTPSADLLRHLFAGTPLSESAWVEVAKLAGFAAVLVPVSLLLLRSAIRIGRSRGTITEY